MLSIFVVSEPPVLLVVGQYPSSQSSKQCLSCIMLKVKTTLSGRFLWEVWQWSLPSLVPIVCGILLALSAGWLGFDFGGVTFLLCNVWSKIYTVDSCCLYLCLCLILVED